MRLFQYPPPLSGNQGGLTDNFHIAYARPDPVAAFPGSGGAGAQARAPAGRARLGVLASGTQGEYCRRMEPTARLIDLSWPVCPGMAMFPGDPPMELRRMGDYATDGFLSHLASLPAHSGTHVDAPGHVLPGAAMLADLPLSRFAGPGVLLDLRGRAELAVTAQDLAPHLQRLADLAPAFVLLWTGDEARWGTPGYYSAGAHLSLEAAELLAKLPGLSGIGIDAGSTDAAGCFALPAHRALLGAGLVIVENLRGLAGLPPTGFDFFCLPVLGLDGSPVRAAASVPGGRA